MFTGIIEESGSIADYQSHEKGARIEISCSRTVDGAIEGDSISVNGVCLTALNIKNNSFCADISQETLNLTTIGSLGIAARVNLERAVTPDSRLGGHIVQGHVDCKGKFLTAKKEGDFWTVSIGFPSEIARYLVMKGSIAVEGISLTIAKLREDEFDIAVIPKTWDVTNLSTLERGAEVNIEVDIIGKYVERLMAFSGREH